MAKLDHAPNNFRGLSMRRVADIEREAIVRVWLNHGLNPTLTPIPPIKTPVKPSKGLLEGMDYTPARHTNVRETWRRFGYKPPSESKK